MLWVSLENRKRLISIYEKFSKCNASWSHMTPTIDTCWWHPAEFLQIKVKTWMSASLFQFFITATPLFSITNDTTLLYTYTHTSIHRCEKIKIVSSMKVTHFDLNTFFIHKMTWLIFYWCCIRSWIESHFKKHSVCPLDTF